MLALKGRQDKFKVELPKEFIPKEIEEKYTKILQSKHSFIYSPIDFLNETIQQVEVLGITNASIQQMQPGLDSNIEYNKTKYHMSSEVSYRSPNNPLSLIDKTLNISFRHTLGYLNYFLIFESFLYMYDRNTSYKDFPKYIKIDMLDDYGSNYSRLMLYNPIIDGIDMLSLDHTQPVANSQQFKVSFKYSNFEYEFINIEEN